MKLDKNYFTCIYNIACAFERKNNWGIAKKWFIKSLKLEPKDMSILYALGLVSYKLGEYGDALYYAFRGLD